MAFAVHTSLSSSLDQARAAHFGAFQPLDGLRSSTTAVNFSTSRCVVKPLNAESKRNDSFVSAAATVSAPGILNTAEVTGNVEAEDYGKLAKELENSSPLELEIWERYCNSI